MLSVKKRRHWRAVFIFWVCALASWVVTGRATPALGAEVIDLRCEYFANPVGIDAINPKLSWIIASDVRGERQIAYQILVASSPEKLATGQGDLWDSGKVVSDQTLYIRYAGAAMQSRMHCWWKVHIWTIDAVNKEAVASAWSANATWSMGLLNPRDWSAKWITASKWFMPANVRPKGFIVATSGWADVDLGASLPIETIRLYPLAADSFPLRFKIEGAQEPQFNHPQILVDQTSENYRPAVAGWQKFPVDGLAARYVRLTITQVPKAGKAIIRQMEIISGGKNVALMRPTHELGPVWNAGHAVFLVDGMPSEGESNECPADACPTTAAPLLRKTFTVERTIKRATLFIAAMGMADVTINGRNVGDELLGPPFTDATKRVIYVTHDVTSLLTAGPNVIGATLANGFFSTPGLGFGQRQGGDGPPRFLGQLEIEFVDGSRQVVATDETWKWARGEITLNDVWAGYEEDRRLAKPGWNLPGYADTDWQPVAISQTLGGALRAPMGPPIRVVGELKPKRVENNRAYFDVLTCGWPRVRVSGHAGQTITLLGHSPGYKSPKLTFTLASDGPAVLEPRFMYLSGPLDVQVNGLLEPLKAENISIQLVHADLKSTGAFTCSNAYLNNLYDITLRTHLNYNGDQPMDPTREKQGWTQDVQNMFDTAAYLTDVAGLYRKWWWDFADGQDSEGYIGSVLPVVGREVNDWNSPWWSGVVVYLPWEHYQYYGDRGMLEEAYEPMCRYVDFLGKMAAAGVGGKWDAYPYLNYNQDAKAAKDGMIMWNGAGDWHNPYTKGQDAVPTPMTTMPAWYYYANVVSRTASLLGKAEDAAKYAAVAADVKQRFNAKYFHPETGLYGDRADSQTGQVLPLALDMVPDDTWKLTYHRLIDAIHAHQDHVGTGFVALPWLLQTLTNSREAALANKIVNQQDFPSWKTLIHDGILGEDWHGGGAQMPSTGGAVGMWMYQSVLGIRPDPAGPGFKRFILAPQPDIGSGLTSAQGYFDCVHGRIGSEWKVEDGKFVLRAEIPANTMATVFIPTSNAKSVEESGSAAANAAGVKFLRIEGDVAVFEVGSGKYAFAADFPKP